MDAVLATVANGGQAIVDIDREACRNKFISHILYHVTLHPSAAASTNPFHSGSQWWGILCH
jgi:hypothetical protein